MHSLNWHCNTVKIYSKFNGLIKTNLSGEIRFRKKIYTKEPTKPLPAVFNAHHNQLCPVVVWWCHP